MSSSMNEVHGKGGQEGGVQELVSIRVLPTDITSDGKINEGFYTKEMSTVHTPEQQTADSTSSLQVN